MYMGTIITKLPKSLEPAPALPLHTSRSLWDTLALSKLAVFCEWKEMVSICSHRRPADALRDCVIDGTSQHSLSVHCCRKRSSFTHKEWKSPRAAEPGAEASWLPQTPHPNACWLLMSEQPAAASPDLHLTPATYAPGASVDATPQPRVLRGTQELPDWLPSSEPGAREIIAKSEPDVAPSASRAHSEQNDLLFNVVWFSLVQLSCPPAPDPPATEGWYLKAQLLTHAMASRITNELESGSCGWGRGLLICKLGRLVAPYMDSASYQSPKAPGFSNLKHKAT
ncbi:PREDICTED: uncharacterized protein LOC105592382 [Cercocebus atys]|uniref:uncharacterized protein LOC105592382 n=1 Tax=Cercocebus atys TaxID=9531 RepID=UPI0005F4FE5B|nr:PREDICTED: uncharacterized protein LOC105592382 [Cercocebus atys]